MYLIIKTVDNTSVLSTQSRGGGGSTCVMCCSSCVVSSCTASSVLTEEESRPGVEHQAGVALLDGVDAHRAGQE